MESSEIVDSREGSSMEGFKVEGCINGSKSGGFTEGSLVGDFVEGCGVGGDREGSKSGDCVEKVFAPPLLFSTKSRSTASSISSSRPLKSSSPGILSIFSFPSSLLRLLIHEHDLSADVFNN